MASQVDQLVKDSPAVQETRVRSLDREDPLEKEWHPLQYFCLGNSMDGGTWQATVHGVTKESDMTQRRNHHLRGFTIEIQRHVSLFCYIVSNQLWEVLEGKVCIWSSLYSDQFNVFLICSMLKDLDTSDKKHSLSTSEDLSKPKEMGTQQPNRETSTSCEGTKEFQT